MNALAVGYKKNNKVLVNSIFTTQYIENLRLDENKMYKVTVINKNSSCKPDEVEPAKEILDGKLIGQFRYIFLFECTNRKNCKKRVCINKIDYILKNSLIREVN